MQTVPRGRGSIIDLVERPYQRSKLFEWLLAHHDEMVAASGGRRVEWRRLCAGFAKEGLTDGLGNLANARTARMTWWRVRKEKARIDALRAAERAERERRAAVSPRRDMPSQFRKGEYGPPLTTASLTPSPMAKLPATTARQIEEGLQLETARGVVITKVTRVYKLQEDGPDYVFLEDGRICPPTNLTSTLTNLASSLEVRQEMNLKSKRPVNYKTEMSYEKLGLRSEDR